MGRSLRVRATGGGPELEVLLSHVRVEALGKLSRQALQPDELEDVSEILEPVRCGHPRGELELDEL